MKYTFAIPSPDDVTVGEFMEFSKARTDIKRCMIATGKSQDEVRDLPISVTKKIVEQYREMLEQVSADEFPKLITLDGVEYGFEPNLRKLQTAAWADISLFEELGWVENLHKILAVLYRPVVQKYGIKNVKYRIEKYAENNGDSLQNADLFLDFKLRHAYAVLAFFLTLRDQLLSNLELKMMKELSKATQEMKEEIIKKDSHI